MSNIYIQEPPTNGKVLLKTSVGDIDIELWSREAPKACRNFIQLCLEGYYTGTVFHRVMKDFIAQGGDPLGTGEGGESVYGKPFRDEIHTRLRFVRRGLVAMANAGKDDNGSQFFFTLGPTQELQGKHTIFGKVTGDTVYNLIKFNDLDTDANDRPTEPPKIKGTEVLMNPFDDIVPRETIKHEKRDKKKPKAKVKGKKDFKLLSFGAEAEEEEEISSQLAQEMRTSGKSAHDLANDPRLSNVAAEATPSEDAADKTDDPPNVSANSTSKPEEDETDQEERPNANPKSRIEKLREEQMKLKKEMKAKQNADEEKRAANDRAIKDLPESVREYRQQTALYEERKKKLPKKATADRESQTLAMLEKFKKKLETVQHLSNQYGETEDDNKAEKEEVRAESSTREPGEEDEAEEDEAEITGDGWLSHKLQFGDSHGKVLDANVTDVDRYEIYDPRNPMTKRRREEAKQQAKRSRKERQNVI